MWFSFLPQQRIHVGIRLAFFVRCQKIVSIRWRCRCSEFSASLLNVSFADLETVLDLNAFKKSTILSLNLDISYSASLRIRGRMALQIAQIHPSISL